MQLENKTFILCGDLNSKLKSLGCTTNNKNGELLQNVLNMNNITILNNKEKTYKFFNWYKRSP
jgi:hypothetical protein